MLNNLRIPHVCTALQVRQPPTLATEGQLRILRSALVVAFYLAGQAQLPTFEHALCVLLRELDRLLEEDDQ